MPTLTQIEYALAVEKHRHFGKAAEACHVSQPTLSLQLQKLEDELGLTVFDRLRKPILPTDEGRRFLDQAKVVIREHQRLLHMARARTGRVSGEFRLGIIPTVGNYLIPLFVEKFAKAHPDIDLYIEELQTETILQNLRDDRLDGAVLATPLRKKDLKEKPLYYEPFELYVSKSHPLLGKKRLHPSDLDGDQMWMLKDGHCFRDQVVNMCSIDAGVDGVLRNVHFQGGSLDTLRNLVRRSRGYTLIPSLMKTLLDAREIREHVRPFVAPVPTREISFVQRRDDWKSDIADAIQETVLKSLPIDLRRQGPDQQAVLEVC